MNRLSALLAAALLPLASHAGYPVPTGRATAQTFPYSMVGQLTFRSSGDAYVGSGSVVQSRGVLTAGHNLYDEDGGWSTDLVFRRGHYEYTDLSIRKPHRIYVLAGYQASSDRYGGDSAFSFARDSGGLLFNRKVARGGYLGWSTDLSLATGPTRKVVLGYGAEKHTGEELLSVEAHTPFRQVFKKFFESAGTGIEGGMSGGPVIAFLPDGSPTLCGVVVSGTDSPVTGGIRAINVGVSSFILSYLGEPPL